MSDYKDVCLIRGDQGRAIRAQTRDLANALFDKAGMSVEALMDLNIRIQTLRDAFRAA